MSKTSKAKAERRNAGTQTREIDTVLEIARLQEQVKLLTIENEHLRKYTSESIFTAQLITPTTSPNCTDKTDNHNESKQKVLQNQSTQRRSTKATIRGCNCKGKCSSKICGCVKKDTHCGKLCKCNSDNCKNQEHRDMDQDKENLAHNELIHNQTKSQQLMNKHVIDVNAHKSLFSPDDTIHDSAFDIQQYQSTPLHIDPTKKLTFTSDEEQTELYQNEKQDKGIKKSMKNENEKTVRNGRNKHKNNDLQINTQSVQNIRSSSNENKHRHSNIETEKQKLRTRSSSEMQMNKKIKEIEKRANSYIRNIKSGMVSLRRHRKETTSNKDIDVNNGGDTGLEKVTSTVSPVNSLKETSKNLTNKISTIPKGETIIQKIQSHKDEKLYDMNETIDTDFNPMKPKRELPRTPVHDSNKTTPCNTHNNSSFVSVVTTTEEEPPVSIDLSQAQVDWEEYQSQLVACNKCKRKFHPLRIKKHQSCCKNI